MEDLLRLSLVYLAPERGRVSPSDRRRIGKEIEGVALDVAMNFEDELLLQGERDDNEMWPIREVRPVELTILCAIGEYDCTDRF